MSLEVWYKSDITNALRAAEHAKTASMAACANDEFSAGYNAGYLAALAVIALAFGFVPRHGVQFDYPLGPTDAPT